jgi:1,4-dihydroxy-2-naphthoyl-CoA hydrolase
LTLTIEEANRRFKGTLPGTLGIEFVELARGHAANFLAIRPDHLAPNGYLHAATVVALADTCCGIGALASLPAGASNFTTIELKTNFIGTAVEGVIRCVAELAHSGRTTQLWDAKVTDEAQQRTLALFRCTQLILYPRENG